MKYLIATLLAGTAVGAAVAPYCAPGLGARARSALLSHIDDDWIPKLSPFTAVEWDGETPHVQVGGAWYSLLELDGLTAERIVAHCKTQHGTRWQKRFSEDLVQVLWELGHEPDATVALVLRDSNGVRSTRAAVPMTEENRQRVWTHNNRADAGLPIMGDLFGKYGKVDRVDREHSREFNLTERDLAEPLALADWADAAVITREQAAQDLDQLEWLIRHRFSYRDLNAIDVAACFDAARLGLRERVSLPEFELSLRKLLARFGDGHTRVDGDIASLFPAEYAPFLIEHSGLGTTALRPDRSGPLDAEHPRLVAIDGIEIERWLDAAAAISARGAEHAQMRRSERNLRYIGWLRAELGLERSRTMEVTLANAAGERVSRELPVTSDKPIYGSWPQKASRLLEGRIGYLRIDRMERDAAFLAELESNLDNFSGARGLIIDVRDNGGGSRDALRLIASRLIDPDRGPLVANVAAYRLAPGEAPEREDGYLGDRFLFPASWNGWSSVERTAIEQCAKAFEPDWMPSRLEFSEWHYMVVSPAAAKDRFVGPVCVLTDEDCFSATDVFLGALAELPQVTLVGRASGGGSGRAREFALAYSGIRVRLSSMASFRPDGRRYDGRGIEVDIHVQPAVGDFSGTTDSDLDAALRLIEAR